MERINISNDIITDANKFRFNNMQKKALTEYISEILRNIQSDLIIGFKEGRHSISYDMPITFEVPNMNNKDCQRIIWSEIIDKLKQKNYSVAWRSFGDKITLFITWINKEDEALINRQTRLLKESQMSDD